MGSSCVFRPRGDFTNYKYRSNWGGLNVLVEEVVAILLSSCRLWWKRRACEEWLTLLEFFVFYSSFLTVCTSKKPRLIRNCWWWVDKFSRSKLSTRPITGVRKTLSFLRGCFFNWFFFSWNHEELVLSSSVNPIHQLPLNNLLLHRQKNDRIQSTTIK